MFITESIEDKGYIEVGDKPYISGYEIDGRPYHFSNDMLALDAPYVIYSGKPITFLIENWEYYEYYVDFWGGDSLDSLTRTEAGSYSVTLKLKSDDENVLYWSRRADNTADRSSVTLKFEIKYNLLTLPEIKTNVEYTGNVIDILKASLGDAEYEKLIAEYGDYVEISGSTGTKIGNYRLNLTIKDEYGDAVRWNDGGTGIAGNYSVIWVIDPIYLVRPESNKDPNATIYYDGNEHFVYESLIGYYGEDGMSDDLALLIQRARISVEGSCSVDAGTFTVTFSLPNSNYAWKNYVGTDSATITWTIEKQVINLNDVEWDYTGPFQYTLVNGQPYNHRVALKGLPEVLQYYVSYRTDGIAGNGASSIGTHTTTFTLNTSALDKKNFDVEVPDGVISLTWEITTRQMANPDRVDEWKYFDGNIHDLMQLLGYEEGWENYLTVTVEYSKDGSAWSEYDAENDPALNYSIYNAYYVGNYRITVKIKENVTDFVVWADGTDVADSKTEIITNEQLEITITGWSSDDQYGEASFDIDIPESILEMFEYVIFDEFGNEVDAEDIENGASYTRELRIKPEYRDLSVYESKYLFGIAILLGSGVENPFEFGTFKIGRAHV